ncbi:unnamed protein product [Calypogeia fissa]
MPAAMEGWRSSGASSKEEQESGGTTGSGAGTMGKGSELAAIPLVAAGSKRQRRPSVRLGEIGDLKVAASKSDALSSARWISPNFIPKKSPSGTSRGGKLPRTRPLANVTHRGEIGQVLRSPKVGTNDVVVVRAAPIPATEVTARDDAEKEEEDAEPEEEAPPSTSGRGNYGATTTTANPRYATTNRRGRPGKRKRAASIRSSTIAKTIGVVALNRKAKELQKVGYVGNLARSAAAPATSTADVSEQLPIEFAELSGTQADMEEDSGAGRGAPGSNDNNDEEEHSEEEDEDHTQNGDTEVLEGDNGNGEDSSGRHEEDEPGTSLGVRDNNQNINTNGTKSAPHEFQVPNNKGDHRDQCTSRMAMADGEKERKNDSTLLVRGASMNGRRGESRVRDWLSSLGLDKYSDLFEENEVDNDVLHLLTFEDLKEMGVVAVGARRKMFAAIQALGPATLVSR